ncbi:hypothetical protein [Iningainema tapete]|uniref:MotA/TolQ/ExbB proton channel domain-containing protein n=1 Tax=Iningainema tapete BLCC-T55 TaxID=2748662 RepID=A0A8J7CA10_9CYAN|nr:hypothetical protein [Iningainema tapete]MBD2778739.1 hypothetical protein [Iningainema tapete BLCC-T55]
MPPIPAQLIVLTLVLVVIPSVAAIFLRFILYRHLIFLLLRVRRLIKKQPSGQKPRILEELEKRFADASKHLEQVNTAALVDQVYSQEKVWLFSCEEIDYFCRLLPNLLLAFGLLGTFLGITLNLSALSQTINQTPASNLVAQLEKPLQGMSIAFTTSLAGLFFSALLTAVNLLRNTSIVKYRLISSLEDYLDNVYQPQIQGDTRLDKIVNKMVSRQDEFLTRFGDTVRDVVEKSLGGVAREIAQGNKEAADLAKQVYERFSEAAGIISAAATEFEHTVAELKAKAEIFKQAGETFEQSQFPQKLSLATADLVSMQEKFSQSTVSLAQTVQFIANAVSEVQCCSQEIIKLGAEIKSINHTSMQVLELHQTNQNSFGEIIPQIKQGANSFRKAVTRFDKLEKRIVDKANSLNGVEVTLTQLLENFKNYSQQVNLSIDSLGDEYKSVGDRLFEGMKQEVEMNIKAAQFLAVKIQECSKHLTEIKQEIYQQRVVKKA